MDVWTYGRMKYIIIQNTIQKYHIKIPYKNTI